MTSDQTETAKKLRAKELAHLSEGDGQMVERCKH